MARKQQPRPPAECFYFTEPMQAVHYLEDRGYALQKSGNWLPPANIRDPGEKDVIAALYLSSTHEYGGIIRLRPCPFCGGRADPRSPIGVECMDCGGNASDIEGWQKRVMG
jgi:hypothetical protein